MLWDTFQNTIADWVADTTGLAVRWDPSNVERPAYPYCELSILSDVKRGQDETSYALDVPTNTLVPTVYGLRQIVVTIKVTTNANTPAKQARAYTSLVVDALADTATIELLSAAKISIVEASPTLSFNAPRNLGIVSIAAFDLRLETLISRTPANTSYIQTAQVAGTIQTPATIEFGPDTYGDT